MNTGNVAWLYLRRNNTGYVFYWDCNKILLIAYDYRTRLVVKFKVEALLVIIAIDAVELWNIQSSIGFNFVLFFISMSTTKKSQFWNYKYELLHSLREHDLGLTTLHEHKLRYV